MKRFIIMGIITLVLVLFILLYNPNNKYLGIYENNMTIENNNEEDYIWNIDIDGEALIVKEKLESDKSTGWNLEANKNGNSTVTLELKDKNDKNKYRIVYIFKVEDKKIIWTKGEALGLLDFPNPY